MLLSIGLIQNIIRSNRLFYRERGFSDGLYPGKKAGGQRVRDGILCTIIGLQNDNGNRVESEQYKAYQRL